MVNFFVRHPVVNDSILNDFSNAKNSGPSRNIFREGVAAETFW